MCYSVDMEGFERTMLRGAATRTNLDEWLKAQTDQEYRSSYEFFEKFGLHLRRDRQVQVDAYMFVEKLYEAVPRFYQGIHTFVVLPTVRTYDEARRRLHEPVDKQARAYLDLIPA